MCVCVSVCLNARVSAQSPYCCSNPLKLNQIRALPSKNKCFVVAFAQMQQAEAGGEALTKSHRYSKAGGYSGSGGLQWVHFLNKLASLASFICRLALSPLFSHLNGTDEHICQQLHKCPFCQSICAHECVFGEVLLEMLNLMWMHFLTQIFVIFFLSFLIQMQHFGIVIKRLLTSSVICTLTVLLLTCTC